jgi:hypothetical protein
LLWQTAVYFLGIAGHFKIYLLLLIGFLSLLFLISMFLVRFSSNFFTHWLYTISAVWIGLFINLFLASLGVWLLFGLLKLAGISFNFAPVVILAFLLAIIYSIYGFFNAFNPRLQEVDVTLKNLPPAWQGKTIAQLSDLHLGIINRAAFLEKIVAQVNGQHPDLIVITGDLFDGVDGDESVFIPALNKLSARDGIFFVTGNHDYYLGKDKVLRILAQTKIQVLQDQMKDLNGLQIIGLDYGNFSGRDDVKDILAKINFAKNQPSILLYHAPSSLADIKASGINLQLSGHTHHGQIWPFNFINNLIYQGHDYGLDHEGDFWLYVTSGLGTWGPPMRTGSRSEIALIKLH